MKLAFSYFEEKMACVERCQVEKYSILAREVSRILDKYCGNYVDESVRESKLSEHNRLKQKGFQSSSVTKCSLRRRGGPNMSSSVKQTRPRRIPRRKSASGFFVHHNNRSITEHQNGPQAVSRYLILGRCQSVYSALLSPPSKTAFALMSSASMCSGKKSTTRR